MSGEDSPDEEVSSADTEATGSKAAGTDAAAGDPDATEATADVRDRIEEGADRAAQQIDESVVDLLAWILDTETRARIYVELRQHPDSTSEEIAEGTGLYPSTVREALAELHEEGKLERGKRVSDGAGNNPYEYRAIAPTELVRDVVGDVQQELNTVFNLDSYLGGGESEGEPVKINVEEEGGVERSTQTGTDDVTAADDAAGFEEAEDTEMVDATDDTDADDDGDAEDGSAAGDETGVDEE